MTELENVMEKERNQPAQSQSREVEGAEKGIDAGVIDGKKTS